MRALDAEKCSWVLSETKTRRWNRKTDETGETAEENHILSQSRADLDWNMRRIHRSITVVSQRGKRGAGRWTMNGFVVSDSKRIITISAPRFCPCLGLKFNRKRLQEENHYISVIYMRTMNVLDRDKKKIDHNAVSVCEHACLMCWHSLVLMGTSTTLWNDMWKNKNVANTPKVNQKMNQTENLGLRLWHSKNDCFFEPSGWRWELVAITSVSLSKGPSLYPQEFRSYWVSSSAGQSLHPMPNFSANVASVPFYDYEDPHKASACR